jgi:hypothetical protein
MTPSNRVHGLAVRCSLLRMKPMHGGGSGKRTTKGWHTAGDQLFFSSSLGLMLDNYRVFVADCSIEAVKLTQNKFK